VPPQALGLALQQQLRTIQQLELQQRHRQINQSAPLRLKYLNYSKVLEH
jgi:hypothetical protein